MLICIQREPANLSNNKPQALELSSEQTGQKFNWYRISAPKGDLSRDRLRAHQGKQGEMNSQ